MRKIIISLAFIAVSFLVWATVYPDAWLVRPKGNQTALIDMLRVKSTLFLPSGTGSPSLGGGKDSTGAVWIEKGNSKLWIYLKSVGWKEYATMAEVDSIDGIHSSGTYLPTYANVDNTSSATCQRASYIRMDSIVHVAGFVQMVVTNPNVLTQFTLTLPIASTMTSVYDANGVIASYNGASLHGTILAHAASSYQKVVIDMTPISNGTKYFSYQFDYKIR